MSNFSINNMNATFSANQGKSIPLKSKGAGINTTDSFKPSLKSATSPIDLKEAAKIFSKKAEEIPNIKWEFQANEKTRFTTKPVFMEDGSLLVKCFDMKLYSVNPKDGSKNWEFRTGTFSYNSPVMGNDNMIFADSGKANLSGIDGKTGTKVWEKEVGGNIHCPPIIGPDGNVYISNGYYCNLIGFDPKTGDEKKKIEVGRHSTLLRGITDEGIAVMIKDSSLVVGIDIESGEQKWEHSVGPELTGGKSTYSPDGCLYTASRDGDLTGIDGKTGKVKWRFNTASFEKKNAKVFTIAAVGTVTKAVNRELLDRPPSVIQDPVIGKDGKVYFYDERSVLFAMDSDTGKPAWIYDSTQEITTNPFVSDNGEVFVGNEKSEVVKLDAKTGKEIWKAKLLDKPIGQPVVTDDNVIFINTEHGHTARLSTETGRVLRSYNTPGRDLKMAVLPGEGNQVVVGDEDGKIICIGREKHYEKVPEVDSSQETNKNLKIEKGKEFVDIGGVKLKIKKEE